MKYSVWPTNAPPVCTIRWDQEAWKRFEDKFRPDWYKGDRYDQEAWDKALKEREQAFIRAFYKKHGVEPRGEDQ